jgi:sugar phosphate isomerase/epimerase
MVSELIISIHGVSLSRVTSSPEEAVKAAADAGFKYIEVPVTTWRIDPVTVTRNEVAEVKATLEAGGVEASSLGMIWPRDYGMVAASAAERDRNLNYAGKLFAFSAELGVKLLNLGGSARSAPSNMPYIEGLDEFVQFWRQACKSAEDLGVTVCIEDLVRSHEMNIGNTSKEIIDLVEAVGSPSFQINAQVHQMAYTDLDVVEALRASRGMVKLVHIADVAGFNAVMDPIMFLSPGRGRLDFASVLRAFKEIGYDGEFCVEPRADSLVGKDYVSELREGRELLEAKWESV